MTIDKNHMTIDKNHMTIDKIYAIGFCMVAFLIILIVFIINKAHEVEPYTLQITHKNNIINMPRSEVIHSIRKTKYNLQTICKSIGNHNMSLEGNEFSIDMNSKIDKINNLLTTYVADHNNIQIDNVQLDKFMHELGIYSNREITLLKYDNELSDPTNKESNVKEKIATAIWYLNIIERDIINGDRLSLPVPLSEINNLIHNYSVDKLNQINHNNNTIENSYLNLEPVYNLDINTNELIIDMPEITRKKLLRNKPHVKNSNTASDTMSDYIGDQFTETEFDHTCNAKEKARKNAAHSHITSYVKNLAETTHPIDGDFTPSIPYLSNSKTYTHDLAYNMMKRENLEKRDFNSRQCLSNQYDYIEDQCQSF